MAGDGGRGGEVRFQTVRALSSFFSQNTRSVEMQETLTRYRNPAKKRSRAAFHFTSPLLAHWYRNHAILPLVKMQSERRFSRVRLAWLGGTMRKNGPGLPCLRAESIADLMTDKALQSGACHVTPVP